MLLNRLSPLRLLVPMQDTFNLFENIAADSRREFAPSAYPPINAWADEHSFFIEAELPGMKLDDLESYVSDGTILVIKGKRNACACDGGKWLSRERGYGSFERQIHLPGAVDQDQVEATLSNGVLLIKLPKAPELRPRRIEVKTK